MPDARKKVQVVSDSPNYRADSECERACERADAQEHDYSRDCQINEVAADANPEAGAERAIGEHDPKLRAVLSERAEDCAARPDVCDAHEPDELD